ncbi:hypothetical protein VNO80_09469 [Phaseolus coccineus]|uniref:Uncharacterized protein n=1 Tax=Phaseolus coccineus TaxID=3886 RepID=A0AAN9RCR0_PHACN
MPFLPSLLLNPNFKLPFYAYSLIFSITSEKKRKRIPVIEGLGCTKGVTSSKGIDGAFGNITKILVIKNLATTFFIQLACCKWLHRVATLRERTPT